MVVGRYPLATSFANRIGSVSYINVPTVVHTSKTIKAASKTVEVATDGASSKIFSELLHLLATRPLAIPMNTCTVVRTQFGGM